MPIYPLSPPSSPSFSLSLIKRTSWYKNLFRFSLYFLPIHLHEKAMKVESEANMLNILIIGRVKIYRGIPIRKEPVGELTDINLPEWYHFPMIFKTQINTDLK